jgi:hypothetical protein
MNRALLEHPFDPAQIKQRKGRNGVLDYVEGHTVVARLNAALARSGRSRDGPRGRGSCRDRRPRPTATARAGPRR